MKFPAALRPISPRRAGCRQLRAAILRAGERALRSPSSWEPHDGRHVQGADQEGMMEGGSDISSRSRRDFLKNVGAGLVGSSILGSSVVSAAGIYDNMELLKHYLPPGILNCRDRAIRILYAQEISRLWDDFDHMYDRMGSEFDGYFDSVIVKPWSRNIEPAWYMLREQINYKNGGIYVPSDISGNSPQMRAFDEGIAHWFNAHKRKYKSAIPKTEDRLFHSISYAAYDDEQTSEEKAAKYLNSDIDGKIGIVLDIRKKLEEMGNGDRESRDPRDPYNRRLVGSWASFILTAHHVNLEGVKTKQGKVIYDNLELFFTHNGFAVRGPPHYKYS